MVGDTLTVDPEVTNETNSGTETSVTEGNICGGMERVGALFASCFRSLAPFSLRFSASLAPIALREHQQGWYLDH